MSDEPEIRIVSVPAIDTGLGREAGYENDAAMIEAYNTENEELLGMLSPETRERLEETEREFMDRIIRGTD